MQLKYADMVYRSKQKYFFLCTEEKNKIAELELKCERLRAQLHQQAEANKNAQEEIAYLKEQVTWQ